MTRAHRSSSGRPVEQFARVAPRYPVIAGYRRFDGEALGPY